MRTGSRRNVCAIDLPGDAGACSPSPIGSSTRCTCFGGAWCSSTAFSAAAALFAAAIALAFCRSPAMRSR